MCGAGLYPLLLSVLFPGRYCCGQQTPGREPNKGPVPSSAPPAGPMLQLRRGSPRLLQPACPPAQGFSSFLAMICHLGSFQGVGAGAELQGGGRGGLPGRGAVQRPGGRTMGDKWGPREGPDMSPVSSAEGAGTGPHPRMGGQSSPTQESQTVGDGGPVLPPPGSLPPFQP